MPSYYYSSTAGTYTLTGAVNAAATILVLNSVSGLPTSTPFKVVLEPGQPAEEVVKVTGVAGTSLTVVRGWDGTSAGTHGAGSTVRHMVTAEDFSLSRAHEDATVAHGATGAVVGTTNAQTLSNKDLSNGTNTFPSTFATKTGVEQLTNKTLITLNTATPAVVIKSVNGIATDIAQVQDYNGTLLAKFANNAFAVNSGFATYYDYAIPAFGYTTQISAVYASTRGLVVAGTTGQSANLQEWRKSDGSVLASVDKDGKVTAPNLPANIASTAAATAGKRMHWVKASGTTNSSALVTITHNAGFVPTVVTGHGNANDETGRFISVFNVTSSDVTLRITNGSGSGHASSPITVQLFLGE